MVEITPVAVVAIETHAIGTPRAMHIPSRHPSTRPFMAAPRTQFYHPAAQIDAAVKGVERCIRRAEGVALVVGPPGTGKSLLLAMVAEHVRDDFDVALLSGASICTRRALWQAVMAAIGEPYRGIDESDLRIAIVERIRGLAATGSGLVILVDEAHTLPTRLIEELRLLTNIPTPLPAVHIVLAGSLRLEEMLAAPRMESLAQRIAVRGYLEPLDHAETMDYLRTQTKAAGLSWDRLFADGCDDAVFKVTDGVPRLVNQVCDQALVLVAESNRRVTPADIAAAWREIQRLPAPAGVEPTAAFATPAEPDATDTDIDDGLPLGMEVMEFGADDAFTAVEPAPPARHDRSPGDPWTGPDVELVGDAAVDPFADFFPDGGRDGERVVTGGPDTFSDRPRVASREGKAMGRLLATLANIEAVNPQPPAVEPAPPSRRGPEPAVPSSTADVAIAEDGGVEDDDADMVVIEDDLADVPGDRRSIFSVRPGDYRSLFTRLRRGDRR
jgi:type II secretory pathway predicted ATPase ExeA